MAWFCAQDVIYWLIPFSPAWQIANHTKLHRSPVALLTRVNNREYVLLTLSLPLCNLLALFLVAKFVCHLLRACQMAQQGHQHMAKKLWLIGNLTQPNRWAQGIEVGWPGTTLISQKCNQVLLAIIINGYSQTVYALLMYQILIK